jgi:cytochrome P450
MPKLDSFLRESQRINSFVTIGVGRQVVARGGVTTPSGVHLREGTKVATHTLPVMKDPAIYDDPAAFHPFRFAQIRENSTERARLAFNMTSNEYFAFGAGRHACPGRVFASTELRLMLACIILDYDFEFSDYRPKNTWFGLHRVPNMEATIRVTKRARR